MFLSDSYGPLSNLHNRQTVKLLFTIYTVLGVELELTGALTMIWLLKANIRHGERLTLFRFNRTYSKYWNIKYFEYLNNVYKLNSLFLSQSVVSWAQLVGITKCLFFPVLRIIFL